MPCWRSRSRDRWRPVRARPRSAPPHRAASVRSSATCATRSPIRAMVSATRRTSATCSPSRKNGRRNGQCTRSPKVQPRRPQSRVNCSAKSRRQLDVRPQQRVPVLDGRTRQRRFPPCRPTSDQSLVYRRRFVAVTFVTPAVRSRRPRPARPSAPSAATDCVRLAESARSITSFDIRSTTTRSSAA